MRAEDPRNCSRPRRRFAALVLGGLLGLAMATLVPTAPAAQGQEPALDPSVCGKSTYYYWEYNDSATVGVDEGCSEKNDVTRAQVPDLIAELLHVSCSDKVSPEGVPTKGQLGDPARRVVKYLIVKDGGKKTCGGDFTPPTPDITVNKIASDDRVRKGDKVTFTLTPANLGAGSATGVTISDPLPAGAEFVSASPGCSYSAGTNTVTCVVGTLSGTSAGQAGSCPDKKQIYFKFQYNDSGAVGIDEGCSEKNDVTRAAMPGLVANRLHVSCSDKISPEGVPTKSDLGDPSRRVTAYFISKDGGKKTCGQGTFTPPEPPKFWIKVKVNKSLCNTATIAANEADANQGNNSSTACVSVKSST